MATDPSEGNALSHVDERGRARMVDVTDKAVTLRHAVARCVVRASALALEHLEKDPDVLVLAKASGIHAAKQTSTLIPLCHPLPLDDVAIDVALGEREVRITARTAVVARTGIEIEAMTACGLAGLTLCMALLGVDPDATLGTLALWRKAGGRSGTWVRAATPHP